MRSAIVLILSFVYLAAANPSFLWSFGGNPAGDYSCVRINEDALPHWEDNFLCSNSHDLSAWVWSSAGIPAGSNDMDCIQWLEPVDYSWQDNYLCIPKTDNEFTYKWYYAGAPNDGSTCVQITEPSDANTWTDNFFCIGDKMNPDTKFTFYLPWAANTPSSFTIPNPVWYMDSSDHVIAGTIIGYGIDGFNFRFSTAGEYPKFRDIVLTWNTPTALSGELTLYLDSGVHKVYNIIQRAGNLACIYGTPHSTPDGDVCVCIPGWFGAACTEMFKVTSTVHQPFEPASWLDATTPITKCVPSRDFFHKPTCEIRGTNPFYTGDLSPTQIQLSGILGSTGTLELELAGQALINVSLTLENGGFYRVGCVNGFYLHNTCVCKTGFTGPYCDVPTCDADCGHGKCVETTDGNTCTCSQYYSSDPNDPVYKCNLFDCAASPCHEHGTCVGAGAQTQCQCNSGWISIDDGYCNFKQCNNHGLPGGGVWSCNHGDPMKVICDFTKGPYPGTYPGWCQTAALSQECSPGANDVPVSFNKPSGMACGVPETTVYHDVANGIVMALHIAAFFLELLL